MGLILPQRSGHLQQRNRMNILWGVMVRACGKTSGIGVGKRARVPGCKHMHYILENLSMTARMEGIMVGH